MPELPEVETVRRGLEKLVLNKKIKDIRVLYSKTIINEETEFLKKLIDVGNIYYLDLVVI